MNWRMSEAQDRLDDVIDRALTEGPQKILRARDAVVVVGAQDYERLVLQQTTVGFKHHLLNGPSLEGLDLHRDRDAVRDIQFEE